MVNLPRDSSLQSKEVSSAFDDIAGVFDTTFERSPVIQRLRQKLYAAIESRAQAHNALLDINCGTGIDALYFANRGMTVMGIDISKKMIEQAQMKAASAGLDNVRFYASSFEQIPHQLSNKYDLAFSNFGGLNCVSRLDQVAGELARLVNPGGYFIAVIMPPFSFSETLGGMRHGNLRYAFRRMSHPSRAAGFGEKRFDVYYHSAAYVRLVFRKWFSTEHIVGFSIISPPPGADLFISRHPRMYKFLIGIDELLERVPLLRSIGDHYMIILRRKTS